MQISSADAAAAWRGDMLVAMHLQAEHLKDVMPS